MCANGLVDGNFVFNTTNPAECGIEIEYKVSHGSASFQTENINVVNNYVSNCTYGIWVAERAPTATTISPRNILIKNNILEDNVNS